MGGGGENSTNFCTRRLRTRSNLLPFYIPFFTKKVPLLYTFIDKSCPFHIQSTLALGTLRYYGHPANADESRPPSETHKEMTETNSRFYGLSLLQKCGHFPAPKRDISLFFFSRYRRTLEFVKNPTIKEEMTQSTIDRFFVKE